MSFEFPQLDNEYGQLLREYCRLASCKKLTDKDADRLTKILTLAEADKQLSFLLNEADHFMAHELGLLESNKRQDYMNQQAKLSECLGFEKSRLNKEVPPFQKAACDCSKPWNFRAWHIYVYSLEIHY